MNVSVDRVEVFSSTFCSSMGKLLGLTHLRIPSMYVNCRDNIPRGFEAALLQQLQYFKLLT